MPILLRVYLVVFYCLNFALFSLSVKRHCCFPVNWKTKKKKKERKKSDITPGI